MIAVEHMESAIGFFWRIVLLWYSRLFFDLEQLGKGMGTLSPSPSTDEVRMNDSSPWTLLGALIHDDSVDERINIQNINESWGHQRVSSFSSCQILLVHAPARRCFS